METEALQQLVQRTHSRKAEERQAALKKMLELPDEALLQLLAQSVPRSGSQGPRQLRLALRALPFAIFAFTIALALSKDPSADRRLKWILQSGGIAMLVVLFAATCMVYIPRWFRERSAASYRLPFSMALLLTGRTDRRFLPYVLSEIDAGFTLFERTQIESGSPGSPLPMLQNPVSRQYSARAIRGRYRKLLRGMLAQIGDGEPLELTSDQHRGLLVVLQLPEEDVDCTVSILNYLEQWGEAAALPALKRLMREDHWYVGSEQVEAAAQRAKESVEARIQLQKQGKTLLRPVHEPETVASQSLLRPTADVAEQAPEQLLRPGRIAPSDESA